MTTGFTMVFIIKHEDIIDEGLTEKTIYKFWYEFKKHSKSSIVLNACESQNDEYLKILDSWAHKKLRWQSYETFFSFWGKKGGELGIWCQPIHCKNWLHMKIKKNLQIDSLVWTFSYVMEGKSFFFFFNCSIALIRIWFKTFKIQTFSKHLF